MHQAGDDVGIAPAVGAAVVGGSPGGAVGILSFTFIVGAVVNASIGGDVGRITSPVGVLDSG